MSSSTSVRSVCSFLAQYTESVVGPGANFLEAYFEVSYVRAYTTGGVAPTPDAQIAIPTHTVPTGLIASGLSPSTPTASPLFYYGGSQVAEVSRWLVGVAAVLALTGFYAL